MRSPRKISVGSTIKEPLVGWIILVSVVTVVVAGEMFLEQKVLDTGVGEDFFQPSTGGWVILNAVWLVLLGAMILRLRRSGRWSVALILVGLLLAYILVVYKILFPIYIETLGG